MHPSDSEAELFAAEVADVTPLPQAAKIQLKAPALPAETIQARRLSALTDGRQDPNPLSTAMPVLVGPHEEISYRRPGVQNGVHRALRLGAYEFKYTLDLHRRNVEQAREDVFQFIRAAVAREERCVRLLHGRSVRATPPALLKSYVSQWLRQLDQVLAFHSALQRNGGSGALYVLLRKNDEARQLNRERYGGK